MQMVVGHPPSEAYICDVPRFEAQKLRRTRGLIRRAPSSSPPRDQLLDSREALPDPAPTITKSFLIKYFGFILFQSGPHILDANAFPSSYLMDSAIECVLSPKSLVIRLCSLALGPQSLVIHSYSSEIDPLFLFLTTLVALHLTPVSKWVIVSDQRSLELASLFLTNIFLFRSSAPILSSRSSLNYGPWRW